MNGPCDLVEDENRRPTVMMNRLLVIWLEGDLEHAKPVIFKENLMVFWSSKNRVQGGVPALWTQFRLVAHGHFPSTHDDFCQAASSG